MVVTALSLTYSSGAAHADTLEQALSTAYQGNPEIQANRDLLSAADEGVVQAQAAYGPTLSVNARHAFTTARTRGPLIPSSNDGFATSAEADLSQPLFTSGRLAANLDAARATRSGERARLRARSQQLILDVVTAYVSLQRDIELHGVAVEIYRLLKQQRDVTVARYRLRDSTRPDVDQTANRAHLAAGRVIAARATVETSAARYRNLVGRYPNTLAPLPQLPVVPALATLYAQAERRNPTLAEAKFAERRSRALVGAARAQMLPQVSAFASAARIPLSPYRNRFREESAVAGVSLTMQIYSGGRQSSALREAIDRNLADQQLVEQARRDMREALATDWSLLQAADTALPRYQEAVRAAERALRGVKTQETSGIRTLRDVLDVTNDLLNARTAAVQTRAERYLLHVAVLRDAGVLTLGLFARLPAYDPGRRRSGAGELAGFPLRPILEPVDRLLLDEGVPTAPVKVENTATFDFQEQASPLAPRVGENTSTPDDN
ncbi:TolC family protein [Novosphingobium malaysiense]|uniref:TolC family protein n=1 Tax=Novosphingobium malaysiense TaxID=1348853 RepID=UPI000692413A|nr:TolC family protein [Novosphingobium malaysiense]